MLTIPKRWWAFLLSVMMMHTAFGQVDISGKITDADGGEDLPFANIFVKGTTLGTSTNLYGFYSLTVPDAHVVDGEITLVYAFVGYAPQERVVSANKPANINVELGLSSQTLKEVVISAERTVQQEALRSTDMSTTRIQMKEISFVPSLGGETDIMKVVQLLPGVQGGSEGGMNSIHVGGCN